jgi:hypothetical protein
MFMGLKLVKGNKGESLGLKTAEKSAKQWTHIVPHTPELAVGTAEEAKSKTRPGGAMLNCYASQPAKLPLKAAQMAPSSTKSISGCSFSPREKVRMRGSTTLPPA